ncbi:MAG TPA: TetR/AcrR family transcriptional regulator [Acidimicrobiales bacterium]|nr:TetR/AcrR family transcriptional regulator [Acidimicrobiales bacterium]
MSQADGSTRLLARAERRSSIVAGAARAFAAAGFDGTSMEDIAASAGVTKLILYRHFESKEELYRSILEAVSSRLGDEVASAVEAGRRRGVIVPAFLTVAREDPDGFRLLWRHSSREPKFAAYAEEVHRAADAFARRLLGSRIDDPVVLDWAAPTAVAFLVEAVLVWLDRGEAAADDRFTELTSRSLEALVATWSG